MKLATVLLVFFSVVTAFADPKIKMYLNNEEISKVIEIYSKAANQKFIIDPGVRGKVSIYNQESISLEEAFDQLSNALAVNGYAISKQGDTMVIQSARNIQRNFIEVSTEKPSMKPQRMYTWVYQAKHISVEALNRELRILPSKDGEMNIYAANNQIIFTDWASNLNRVADILAKLDIPENPAVTKITKKGREDRKAEMASKPRFAPAGPGAVPPAPPAPGKE